MKIRDVRIKHGANYSNRNKATAKVLPFEKALFYRINKENKMETSVLTVKGQLLIPKRIRSEYGIEPGVKVVFEETDRGVLIRR